MIMRDVVRGKWHRANCQESPLEFLQKPLDKVVVLLARQGWPTWDTAQVSPTMTASRTEFARLNFRLDDIGRIPLISIPLPSEGTRSRLNFAQRPGSTGAGKANPELFFPLSEIRTH
jgi:hypothetical protein